MPTNGKKRTKKPTYRHEAVMAETDKVAICVRLPLTLHEKLVEVQAEHMQNTGHQVSRNNLIVNILSRHVESGRRLLT